MLLAMTLMALKLVILIWWVKNFFHMIQIIHTFKQSINHVSNEYDLNDNNHKLNHDDGDGMI